MKLVSIIALALTVGCSKVATVPVSLSAASGTELGAVAKRIELKHEDDGWIKVKANLGDAKFQKLSNGNTVRVAMAEVPKGTYTAVRAVFMVPAKDSTKGFGKGPRASGNNNKGMVEQTAMTKGKFCAKGKDGNDITLTISQNTYASEPTIKIGQKPSCK